MYVDADKNLYAECIQCKSVTTIVVSTKVELGWGEGAEGRLTVFK
jgi:hypothetical protein